MEGKKLPTIDEIDISKVPDEQMGRLLVIHLLSEFSELPEDERGDAFRRIKTDRDAFIITLKGAAVEIADDRSVIETIIVNDLQNTAEGVADAVCSALEQVYPL